MSEQDTSEEVQVASKQPTNTGHNSSEPAASSNKWDGISVLTLLTGLLSAGSWVMYFYTGAERNDPKIHWLPISLMLTIIFVVILFLWKKLWVFKNISRFNSWIFGVTIIGGAIAFLLPLGIANDFAKDSEGTTLRQILIYTTGGLLGVITLSETRRKNDLEKSKFIEQQIQFEKQLKSQKDTVELQLESQEKTLKLQLGSQEKTLKLQLKAQHDNLELQLTSQEKKDKRDHTRQVHAERRSRYTKAVEQLANENAAVRLGGVYTLVGLVDEWLADSNIKEKEDRRKEGQVIINNLCSYIRSPFPLAAKIEEYEAHKELEKLQKSESGKLSEEESLRLQILIKRFEDSDEYEKPKDITTDYAKFHEEQDVRRTIFVEMSKRSSTFPKNGEGEIIEPVPGIWSDFDFDFSRAPIFYPLNDITIEKGIFSSTKFYSNADFSEAKFTQKADFSGAKFTQIADFSWATFAQIADFSEAAFTQIADFSKAKFFQTADFSKAKFTQDADFSGATFTKYVYFLLAEFTQNANFRRVRFAQNANFSGATFTQNANFSGATFTQNANFSGATFSASSPKFVEISKPFEQTFRAQFAVLSDKHGEHEFTVREGSKLIEPGKATLLGETFEIPLGTVLFDPMSPKNRDGNYSGLSEPAK